jgi:hypothetical protein
MSEWDLKRMADVLLADTFNMSWPIRPIIMTIADQLVPYLPKGHIQDLIAAAAKRLEVPLPTVPPGRDGLHKAWLVLEAEAKRLQSLAVLDLEHVCKQIDAYTRATGIVKRVGAELSYLEDPQKLIRCIDTQLKIHRASSDVSESIENLPWEEAMTVTAAAKRLRNYASSQTLGMKWIQRAKRALALVTTPITLSPLKEGVLSYNSVIAMESEAKIATCKAGTRAYTGTDPECAVCYHPTDAGLPLLPACSLTTLHGLCETCYRTLLRGPEPARLCPHCRAPF